MALSKVDAKKFRETIEHELEMFVLERETPDMTGTNQCYFWENGCKRRFRSKVEVRRHLQNCFFGVMQYCKQNVCNSPNGRISRTLPAFAQHAVDIHKCQVTKELGARNIPIPWRIMYSNPLQKGYDLSVLHSFEFLLDGEKVRVLLGAILQDLGRHCRRFMLAPFLHTLNGNVSHLVEMESRIHGDEGLELVPISYRGYEFEGDGYPTVTSYCFNKTLDFLVAADRVDGVVAYASDDFKLLDTSGISDDFRLDVSFKGYRCIVQENGAFPMVPWALNWNDLSLEPGVRETMSDGDLLRPSYLTRILLPQIKGQVDVLVESSDSLGVSNAIMGAFLDEVVKDRSEKQNKERNAFALVIYPDVSSMRLYQSEWRKRTLALGIDALFFDFDYDCLKSHLQRFGSDIVLITPSLLRQLLNESNGIFKSILTKQLRFVYFHNHYENCSVDAKVDLNNIMSMLPVQKNGITRIAFVEYMSEQISKMSTDIDGDQASSTSAISYAPIFDQGWNQFTLGPNQDRLITEMQEQIIHTSNLNQMLDIVIEKIQTSGKSMHWVILHSVGCSGVNLLKTKLSNKFGYKQVVSVTNEFDILCNAYFWDPFLERDETTVLIGPYFLLNFPQIKKCHGVIFFTPPPHQAYRVRVSTFTKLQDNACKPVISFTSKNNSKNKT